MASTASSRLWRVYKEAGRPIPAFSDDDVIDYMVTEAICIKVANEDKQAEKEAKLKNWKSDHSSLDHLR